jgi:AraC family transcriptional regulator
LTLPRPHANTRAVILTELPDLSPRPANAAQERFRREFYGRWGRENCVVSGFSRRAEYGQFRQTLSIKCAARGTEHYFVDRRRVAVGDDTYLVLNEGRTYGSLLAAPEGAYSFAIFFRPGLAAEVCGDLARSPAEALDDGAAGRAQPLEFSEALRRHDSLISPVLRLIQREIAAGARDEQWLEEQCQFLVARLIRVQRPQARGGALADVPKATRAELLRRLQRAVDLMHARLADELGLEDLAAAANLSRFHFLRTFRLAYGCTPIAYLRALRTQRAVALLESTSLRAHGVARAVGLSRHALWRSLCDLTGAGVRTRRRCPDGTARAAFLGRAACDALTG